VIDRTNGQASVYVDGTLAGQWPVDTRPAASLPDAQLHVGTTAHRVLIVAESEGRRESLLELLRDSRIEPPSVASLAAFEAGDEHYAIAVAPRLGLARSTASKRCLASSINGSAC